MQLPDGKTKVVDINSGFEMTATPQAKQAMEVVHNQVTIEVTPGVNYVLKMV